jgi:hypothetical protein
MRRNADMATDKIKYLYIDDENAYAESCSEAVERSCDCIDIDCRTPDVFDEEIQILVDCLDSYDGIILDWKLDLIPNEKNRRVAFRAGSLAQEIRSRGSERTLGKDKGLKELPVVIWSVQNKLVGSFYGDMSSSDLFDAVYDKDRDVVDDSRRTASELVALAEGYRSIARCRTDGVQAVLDVLPDQAERLDGQFLACFAQLASIHDYARFLLKEAILTPGPLVDERLLAARLGVRINTSAWQTLRDSLADVARYEGPFGDAWARWWWPFVECFWWAGLFEGERVPSLSVLTADERVELLKKRTGISELVPAEPVRSDYNRRFYTLCEIDGLPLDPVDGAMLGGKEPLSWQDRRYISIHAAIEGRYRDCDWTLHPAEEDRVKALQAEN